MLSFLAVAVSTMTIWLCPPVQPDATLDEGLCLPVKVNYVAIQDCEARLADWSQNGFPFQTIPPVYPQVTSGWTVQAECPVHQYEWTVP